MRKKDNTTSFRRIQERETRLAHRFHKMIFIYSVLGASHPWIRLTTIAGSMNEEWTCSMGELLAVFNHLAWNRISSACSTDAILPVVNSDFGAFDQLDVGLRQSYLKTRLKELALAMCFKGVHNS